MKTILILALLITSLSAQTPTPTPIETVDCDVYDTRKITGEGTITLSDTTAYIYSLNIVVNEPGSGGRIRIGGTNAIANHPTNIMNYSMSWSEGIPSFNGITIISSAAGCDVDVTIDYRKTKK
jgi:hypothetical protein